MDKVKKIKVLMTIRGIKGVDLARELGVHPTAIYHVIHRRGKSKRIQEFIAHKLKVPYHDLWEA
ncbi:MAG: hypothetical protein RMI74_05630 [Thermodesulfobacterium sp.]|nr:hypothetical protein [Thermodesulfobacterium sp.]